MNISEREELFKHEVYSYTIYSMPMLDQFYDYWSESNRSKTKMKFELEKTWDLSKRLKRWSLNNINWKHGNSNNQQQDELNGIYARIKSTFSGN